MGKSRRGRNNRDERDTSAISNQGLFGTDLGVLSFPVQKRRRERIEDPFSADLTEYDDRRTWRPSDPRAAYKVAASVRRSLFSKLSVFGIPAEAYREKQRLLVCARRKIRKEVLHATGIDRINKMRKKGSGSGRKITWQSKIKC